MIKNPSFTSASSEPKDGEDGTNKEEGGAGGNEGDNNAQDTGTNDNVHEGGLEGGDEGSEGEGSAGGMGEQDDDHLFNPGDLCIDSGADDQPQDDEDKEDKDEKELNKEKDKEEEIYDPEHVTETDDEQEQKDDALYDPMEATASSPPSPPSQLAEVPSPAEDTVPSPVEEDDSQDQEDPENQESESRPKSTRDELYDPMEVTKSDDEDEHRSEQETEQKVDDIGNKEDSEKLDSEQTKDSNPDVDEETSKVVTAISDILKLKETEESEEVDRDSQSPFKSYDKVESPASALKEQSENAQMPPTQETHNPEAPGDESYNSDCPTPVADENGPESPDPETQNPENFAFSRSLSMSGLNETQSDETSPTATPNQQNDVTPDMSPISNSEIPLAKQGVETPEHDDQTSKTSGNFPEGGEWEIKDKDSDVGMTDSEEEEFRRRFLPVSELPRIPKKRKPTPEVIVIDDEDSPEDRHKSVLEKASSRDDSYRWEKSKRRDRSKERRHRSRDSSEERHSRHRRHRDDDSDDGRRERKKKRHRRSRSRSRSRKSRDRDRSRRSRSRERRKSRRGRSRSRDRKRSRSRDRERKRHTRSRTPKRKDKHKDRDRDRDRSREREKAKKRERERRSPSRDRFGRSVPSEYKASIKTFTQAIKDVATPDSGRKFKLKRNFYNEVIDGSNSSDDVPLPAAEPPKEKKESRKEKSRKEKEREKEREERGGWRTPSPVPEQKIETVISKSRKAESPVFERNEAYSSDSDSSLSSQSDDHKTPVKSNNIAIRTEDPQKSPPRLYSNYDPSDPTEEAASPPIPPDEKAKTPPPIPGLGSPHRTGPPPIQDPSAASLMFTGSPLSLDPLRNPTSAIDMIREPPPGFLNPENPIRPQGVMLRTPLGLVPGGQVMVNPLMGPPPPFGVQIPGGPPPQFPGGPQQGGRLQTPGFIQLPGGQRLPVSQNGVPGATGDRPGMIMDGLPPGMRPVLPDTRLPPPSSTATSLASQPALPAKALEQMQQISNLLNAQAKLAQFVPGKSGSKTESEQSGKQGILGAPPPGLKPLERQSTGPFKVPLPPPPLNNKENSNTDSGKKSKKVEETTEVVDMDVASPYSDDEVGINISFSPPLRKRSRKEREADKKKAKQDTDKEKADIEQKFNEVFGKPQKTTTTTTPTKKKKEKSVNVKFNLEKKPSALVKPSKAVTKPASGTDDVPTSAVELDKQQKVRRSKVCARTEVLLLPSSLLCSVRVHVIVL